MQKNHNELKNLANVGKVLAANLEKVGITTTEQLRKTGSENAFIKIRTVDKGACLCVLYALEGAIQNTRWHNLSKDKKDELKIFFKMVEKI